MCTVPAKQKQAHLGDRMAEGDNWVEPAWTVKVAVVPRCNLYRIGARRRRPHVECRIRVRRNNDPVHLMALSQIEPATIHATSDDERGYPTNMVNLDVKCSGSSCNLFVLFAAARGPLVVRPVSSSEQRVECGSALLGGLLAWTCGPAVMHATLAGSRVTATGATYS